MAVRGQTLTVDTELVTETCCSCGVLFAMAKEFYEQCRLRPGISIGKEFYCPAGHRQWYTGETEADKLRRERNQLKQQLAQKDDEIRDWIATANDQRDKAKEARAQANGYKGLAARNAKKLNRIKAGVCPCCNRSFEDVARHMLTKHPDFKPGAPLEVIEGGKDWTTKMESG